MDERDIQIFQTLMETKNVTKTAQTLYTTQSAITKRLHKLEEELGAPLFLRSVKGLIPAPSADAIAGEMEQLQASLQRVKNLSQYAQGRIAGHLKLGVSVNYARYTLPDRLSGSADFRHHRPEPGPVHPAPGGEAVFGRAPGPFPLVRPEPAPFQRKGVCGHQ